MAASTQFQDTITIAVMGATGAGKSTFINLVSGSHLRVGYGLESCTSEVQVASPFLLDGKLVTLIDTPGFDDTVKTEAEILRVIASFLTATYEGGRKLNGVIFLHRISDHRMGGVARKNFRLFRKLCGDDALSHVVITTNMWGDVTPEIGERREKELAANELFFKPALDKGARLVRHDDTRASAQRILREVMGFPPRSLLIQSETVDQHKSLAQTNAGLDLQAELQQEVEKHRKELNGLKDEMQEMMKEAMKAKDAQHQEELDEMNATVKEVQSKLEKLEEEGKVLREERDGEREKHTEQMKSLAVAMQEKEAEFRALQQDVQDQKSRIEQLEAALQAAESKANEQERIRQKAEEDLKASNMNYQEEMKTMREELKERLIAVQKETMAKVKQSQAQEHWAKVFAAQREKRGFFGAVSLVMEQFLGSSAAR